MASGYIAGGALAAIVIAILQGVPKQGLANFNRAVEDWSTAHNPLFAQPRAISFDDPVPDPDVVALFGWS